MEARASLFFVFCARHSPDSQTAPPTIATEPKATHHKKTQIKMAVSSWLSLQSMCPVMCCSMHRWLELDGEPRERPPFQNNCQWMKKDSPRGFLRKSCTVLLARTTQTTPPCPCGTSHNCTFLNCYSLFTYISHLSLSLFRSFFRYSVLVVLHRLVVLRRLRLVVPCPRVPPLLVPLRLLLPRRLPLFLSNLVVACCRALVLPLHRVWPLVPVRLLLIVPLVLSLVP